MNNTKKMINEFRGEYFFLSNFYYVPITIDGITYRSVENAYQAMKCSKAADRAQFANISAKEAKALGKTVPMRANWDKEKFAVMLELLMMKFDNNELAFKLIHTQGAISHDNYWRDTFWGRYNNKGSDYLGLMLMQIRSICIMKYRNFSPSDIMDVLKRDFLEHWGENRIEAARVARAAAKYYEKNMDKLEAKVFQPIPNHSHIVDKFYLPYSEKEKEHPLFQVLYKLYYKAKFSLTRERGATEMYLNRVYYEVAKQLLAIEYPEPFLADFADWVGMHIVNTYQKGDEGHLVRALKLIANR